MISKITRKWKVLQMYALFKYCNAGKKQNIVRLHLAIEPNFTRYTSVFIQLTSKKKK